VICFQCLLEDDAETEAITVVGGTAACRVHANDVMDTLKQMLEQHEKFHTHEASIHEFPMHTEN